MTLYMMHFNYSFEPGYPFWNFAAVGKWRHDAEVFAEDIGAKLLNGFTYGWDDEPEDVLSARMDGILAPLKRNDIVIVQWMFANDSDRWVQTFIDRIHMYNAKVVLMITDINSWRDYPRLDPNDGADHSGDFAINHEAKFFSQADGLILHSPKMRERLAEQLAIGGYEMPKHVTYFGPYGYQAVFYKDWRRFDRGIDFAGSLSKAQYLLDLPEDLRINLYGVEQADLDHYNRKNLFAHPRVDPQAIPHMLDGSYGLVWDSETYPTVTGFLGDYQRFNTPSKLPMYLAADEPVIVWSESSQAEWVRQNGVGLVIDDLTQLNDAISAIDEGAYNAMLERVQRVSPLIRSGFYIQQAIRAMQAALLDWYVDNPIREKE